MKKKRNKTVNVVYMVLTHKRIQGIPIKNKHTFLQLYRLIVNDERLGDCSNRDSSGKYTL